jgi:hypothetical protein
VQNKKTERFLVKLGIGGLTSLVLGLAYKLGERAGEEIDEKYEKEHGVPKTNKKPW